MRRPRLLICAAALLLAGCTASSLSSATTTTTPPVTSAPASTAPPSSPAEPLAGTIIQKTVATGLDHPAMFVPDKTGAIHYGERLTGEIPRIDPKTGKNTSVLSPT